MDFDTDRFGDDSRCRVVGQEPIRPILPRQSECCCFAGIEETVAHPALSIERRGFLQSTDRDVGVQAGTELRIQATQLALDCGRNSNCPETEQQLKSACFGEVKNRPCVGDDPSQGASSFSDRAQRISSCWNCSWYPSGFRRR